MEMCSKEVLKQTKELARKEEFSEVFIKSDKPRHEQEKIKEECQKASYEARTMPS